MVQNSDRKKVKEKVYEFVANNGIKLLQKIFPEYYAKEPLGATDRYIEYPFVLSNLPETDLINSKRVLDVGCSGSMFPLILKALRYDVMGIDIRSYPMRDRIAFLQQDITQCHLADNLFDVVTAVSTIEHIGLKGRYGVSAKRRIEGRKAIKEIHRVLKPGGLFLMTVPFGDKYEVTKNHIIYSHATLRTVLSRFSFTYKTVPSPEADYELALIRATK